MLPSTMTVQAPQSPELQPSLLPVRFSSSRSTSSKVCCGSQRNSTGSPLMIVDTCCLAISGLPRRARRRAQMQWRPPVVARTPATLVRYSIVPRLSLIGLQARCAAVSSRESVSSSSRWPFEGVGGLVDDELGRRHGAEHDARIGAEAGGVQGDIDAASDHRDIHLGTRDEAQIGVRLPRLGLWHAKLDDELALLERSLPGPGDDRLDRRLALAIRAGNDGDRARADQRRDTVRGGRRVAQIADERGASLDLLRADQVDALDDPRPGVGKGFVLAQHDPRGGGADHKAVAGPRECRSDPEFS